MSRVAIAALMIAALLGLHPSRASAGINGTSWTCIIVCGGTFGYEAIKLTIDNNKADGQGNEVDKLLNRHELPPLPNVTPPPPSVGTFEDTSLRVIRAKVIDEVLEAMKHHQADFTKSDPTLPGKESLRGFYEAIRTNCWNPFIFAAASKGTASCAGSADDYKGLLAAVHDSNLPTDPTDLNNAFSNGATLYQQVLDQKVGSIDKQTGANYDDNDLRAKYLYAIALELVTRLDAITGLKFLGANAAALDLSGLTTNCGLTINTVSCLTSLAGAESTLAADRRQDVACDIALRAQFPEVTTIVRIGVAIDPFHQVTEENPINDASGHQQVDKDGHPLWNGRKEGRNSFNFNSVTGC